jgi:nucleotide-binding universal stress UspA family protein
MTQLNLRHILVPIDFSEPSLNALDTAIAMAKRHGAILTVHHVANELIPYYGSIDVLLINTPILKILHEESDLRLKTFTDELINKHQIEIHAKVTQGIVVSEICAVAESLGADLIVMGTHGASGFREFFIGTHAYEVVKRAPCPVLTVPPTGKWESFSKILFPIRNTDGALEKYDFLRKIIQKNKSVLVVLGLQDENDERAYGRIESMILRLKNMLNEDNVLYLTSQEVPSGRTANLVLDTAEREKNDLIAITATLDREVSEFFIGPYAQQIVNHAKVPVLSIRSVKKHSPATSKLGRGVQQYLDLKQMATAQL